MVFGSADMNQPEPQGRQFSTLMSDIEAGRIKIPQFQRDFVWTKDKSAKLLDSILKGFPIGTIILWKTKEQLRTVRNIGNAELPDTPAGDYAQQVLDGQQRLTSLYASVKGLTVPRDGVTQDFSAMFVDLDAAGDSDVVVADIDGKAEKSYIRLRDLLNADFTFLAGFPAKYHEKLKTYQDRLRSYSGPTETNIGQDIRRIDSILKGNQPDYDFGVDTSPQFIRKNGYFNAGRSFIKAILCVYAHHEPKSFADDSLVRISNDWLKQANSKNYHHYFPKAFLARSYKDLPYALVNHIANITIVDDFLNKRQIRDKAPSVYMRQFEKKNPKLARTMRTHLIRLERSGIWEDDYQTFLDMRCRMISKELKKRIIPREIDEAGQATVSEPVEDEQIEEGVEEEVA